MTTTQFWKGFLMMLVGFVVSVFSTTPIIWSMVIISLIVSVLIYFGKNLIPWLHSASPVGALSLINIVSALLILIGNALGDALATIAGTGHVDWIVALKIAASVTITYLNATFLIGPYNPVKTKFLK